MVVRDPGAHPIRELGFSAEGRVVVVGPFRQNWGLWTDSPVSLDPDSYAIINADEFERHWQEAIREFG